MSLKGYVLRKDGYYAVKGTYFVAYRAGPLEFWAYALAYRLTGNQFMWEMARSSRQRPQTRSVPLHLSRLGRS